MNKFIAYTALYTTKRSIALHNEYDNNEYDNNDEYTTNMIIININKNNVKKYLRI